LVRDTLCARASESGKSLDELLKDFNDKENSDDNITAIRAEVFDALHARLVPPPHEITKEPRSREPRRALQVEVNEIEMDESMDETDARAMMLDLVDEEKRVDECFAHIRKCDAHRR